MVSDYHPPSQKNNQTRRRDTVRGSFLIFILPAGMVVGNYWKLKHAKLTTRRAHAGRFDMWSLTKADGPGIDVPPNPMTRTDFSTSPKRDYPQCNTRRREKPCGGTLNYMPPRALLGTRVLFAQLMITVMWHQLYVRGGIGNDRDSPAKLHAHPCHWCLLFCLITSGKRFHKIWHGLK